MPRLSSPHSDAVRDLIAQVRFAPRAALLKQAENAEGLAAEIEPSRVYPEDWLVFRVTGFAPDLDAPRVVPGEMLLHDLSSLVEHLTEAAKLRVGEPAAEGATCEELSRRWNVARRTIERFRRVGLVARRAIDEHARGRVRLVFSPAAIEAFENRRGGILAHDAHLPSPPRSKHLTATERAEALVWAERFHARAKHTSTLNQCAARLARRMGRSQGSVRRLLASASSQAAHALPSVSEPLSRRDRGFAMRAQRAGIAMPRIAARLGVSVPAVHRLITIARFESLDAFVAGSARSGAEAEASLRADAVASALAHPLVRLDASVTQPSELVPIPGAAEAPPVAAADERAVALAHAHLRRLALNVLATADRVRPDAALADEAETRLRHALRLKRRLLRMVLPLIRRTLLQHAQGERRTFVMEDASLRLRCLAEVSGAIDVFVPSATGRLAAPVSLVLARELAGHARDVPSVLLRERPLPLESRVNAETPPGLCLPPHVRRGLDVLTRHQKEAILARFGTDAEPPLALAEIAAIHSITAQGWWAMYRKAAKAGAKHRT